MWSILFLALSSLQTDFAKGELSSVDEVKIIRRSKRGFTYPGTLWCGAGNNAENFDQLGEFAETDKCCRTHDQCPHVIHAFSSKYGFTNFKWHSISHCDCDDAMKQCLRSVNDTASRVVGQAFFNVIEVPCFEFSLEEQCVERHWYGVCKRYDKVSVAVIKESVAYDFGGIDVIDELEIPSPGQKTPEEDANQQEIKEHSKTKTKARPSAPPSSVSEEPSLTNVMTAAEDFIKVLATVSTSQSSSEAQSSDKKRKKDAGKKKKDSKKREGKGNSRKKTSGKVLKADEHVNGAASTTEKVVNKNELIENSENLDWIRQKVNGEHSNKMMKDDHQRVSEERHSSSINNQDPKQKAERDKKSMCFPASVGKHRTGRPKQNKERKRQRHPALPTVPEKDHLHNMLADNSQLRPTESSSPTGLTTQTLISSPGEAELHDLELQHEKGSAFTAPTQNTPIVKRKKLKSGQRWGRKRSQKQSIQSSRVKSMETSSILTSDRTWESSAVTEKMQPNTSETERPLIQSKVRQPRLKGRKKSVEPNKDIFPEDTRKPSQEASTAVTSNISSGFNTDVKESNGQILPNVQTVTPVMHPAKSRRTQRRKSKGRHDKKNGQFKISKT